MTWNPYVSQIIRIIKIHVLLTLSRIYHNNVTFLIITQITIFDIPIIPVGKNAIKSVIIVRFVHNLLQSQK